MAVSMVAGLISAGLVMDWVTVHFRGSPFEPTVPPNIQEAIVNPITVYDTVTSTTTQTSIRRITHTHHSLFTSTETATFTATAPIGEHFSKAFSRDALDNTSSAAALGISVVLFSLLLLALYLIFLTMFWSIRPSAPHHRDWWPAMKNKTCSGGVSKCHECSCYVGEIHHVRGEKDADLLATLETIKKCVAITEQKTNEIMAKMPSTSKILTQLVETPWVRADLPPSPFGSPTTRRATPSTVNPGQKHKASFENSASDSSMNLPKLQVDHWVGLVCKISRASARILRSPSGDWVAAETQELHPLAKALFTEYNDVTIKEIITETQNDPNLLLDLTSPIRRMQARVDGAIDSYRAYIDEYGTASPTRRWSPYGDSDDGQSESAESPEPELPSRQSDTSGRTSSQARSVGEVPSNESTEAANHQQHISESTASGETRSQEDIPQSFAGKADEAARFSTFSSLGSQISERFGIDVNAKDLMSLEIAFKGSISDILAHIDSHLEAVRAGNILARPKFGKMGSKDTSAKSATRKPTKKTSTKPSTRMLTTDNSNIGLSNVEDHLETPVDAQTPAESLLAEREPEAKRAPREEMARGSDEPEISSRVEPLRRHSILKPSQPAASASTLKKRISWQVNDSGSPATALAQGSEAETSRVLQKVQPALKDTPTSNPAPNPASSLSALAESFESMSIQNTLQNAKPASTEAQSHAPAQQLKPSPPAPSRQAKAKSTPNAPVQPQPATKPCTKAGVADSKWASTSNSPTSEHTRPHTPTKQSNTPSPTQAKEPKSSSPALAPAPAKSAEVKPTGRAPSQSRPAPKPAVKNDVSASKWATAPTPPPSPPLKASDKPLASPSHPERAVKHALTESKGAFAIEQTEQAKKDAVEKIDATSDKTESSTASAEETTTGNSVNQAPVRTPALQVPTTSHIPWSYQPQNIAPLAPDNRYPSEELAVAQFHADFPYGAQTIHTSSKDYLCGMYAPINSLQAGPFGDEPPTIDELKEIMSSKRYQDKVAKAKTQYDHSGVGLDPEQIDMLLNQWAEHYMKPYDFRVGVVCEGGATFFAGEEYLTGDFGVNFQGFTVWLYNNNVHERLGTEWINHYSGVVPIRGPPVDCGRFSMPALSTVTTTSITAPTPGQTHSAEPATPTQADDEEIEDPNVVAGADNEADFSDLEIISPDDDYRPSSEWAADVPASGAEEQNHDDDMEIDGTTNHAGSEMIIDSSTQAETWNGSELPQQPHSSQQPEIQKPIDDEAMDVAPAHPLPQGSYKDMFIEGWNMNDTSLPDDDSEYIGPWEDALPQDDRPVSPPGVKIDLTKKPVQEQPVPSHPSSTQHLGGQSSRIFPNFGPPPTLMNPGTALPSPAFGSTDFNAFAGNQEVCFSSQMAATAPKTQYQPPTKPSLTTTPFRIPYVHFGEPKPDLAMEPTSPKRAADPFPLGFVPMRIWNFKSVQDKAALRALGKKPENEFRKDQAKASARKELAVRKIAGAVSQKNKLKTTEAGEGSGFLGMYPNKPAGNPQAAGPSKQDAQQTPSASTGFRIPAVAGQKSPVNPLMDSKWANTAPPAPRGQNNGPNSDAGADSSSMEVEEKPQAGSPTWQPDSPTRRSSPTPIYPPSPIQAAPPKPPVSRRLPQNINPFAKQFDNWYGCWADRWDALQEDPHRKEHNIKQIRRNLEEIREQVHSREITTLADLKDAEETLETEIVREEGVVRGRKKRAQNDKSPESEDEAQTSNGDMEISGSEDKNTSASASESDPESDEMTEDRGDELIGDSDEEAAKCDMNKEWAIWKQKQLDEEAEREKEEKRLWNKGAKVDKLCSQMDLDYNSEEDPDYKSDSDTDSEEGSELGEEDEGEDQNDDNNEEHTVDEEDSHKPTSSSHYHDLAEEFQAWRDDRWPFARLRDLRFSVPRYIDPVEYTGLRNAQSAIEENIQGRIDRNQTSLYTTRSLSALYAMMNDFLKQLERFEEQAGQSGARMEVKEQWKMAEGEKVRKSQADEQSFFAKSKWEQDEALRQAELAVMGGGEIPDDDDDITDDSEDLRQAELASVDGGVISGDDDVSTDDGEVIW